MRKLLVLVLALTSGCTVNKVLVPTGGSRADGTVEMSYEVGEFEDVVVDLAQGAEAARQRCVAWGYSDAQAFGAQKRVCQIPGGFSGCAKFLVTIEYQCIGANTPQ